MACEKCWGDAYMRMLGQPSKSQAVHYQELLAEREEEPCTIWEREGFTHEEWLERERKNDERSLTDLLDDAQKAVDAAGRNRIGRAQAGRADSRRKERPMSGPKWTEGDWCVDVFKDYYENGVHAYEVGTADDVVAVLDHEPDAHLIAAAPKLYSALLNVQWSVTAEFGNASWLECPQCGGACPECQGAHAVDVHVGHKGDCILASALAKAHSESVERPSKEPGDPQ